MEITTRYGIEFDPFQKNAIEIPFVSQEWEEVMFRLNYLRDTKGFGLLTGLPGCGKTTIVRHWASKLNPSSYTVVYTSLSTLSVNEFYRTLACGLGLQPAHRKADNFRSIQAEIMRLSVEKHKTPVFILDEVEHISNGILNELRMLFNFEMDSKDRAVVLLVGLSSINRTLNLRIHEPLQQRIIMNYNIDGLSKENGRAYIQEKLKGAGCTQPIFDESAIEAILNKADGVPRIINKLCSEALLIGNSHSQSTITRETAMDAIRECTIGD